MVVAVGGHAQWLVVWPKRALCAAGMRAPVLVKAGSLPADSSHDVGPVGGDRAHCTQETPTVRLRPFS